MASVRPDLIERRLANNLTAHTSGLVSVCCIIASIFSEFLFPSHVRPFTGIVKLYKKSFPFPHWLPEGRAVSPNSKALEFIVLVHFYQLAVVYYIQVHLQPDNTN